jgi:hypothetical protein
MTSALAIVTPSYGPDFELCRTLNRSVLEFFPAPVKHYLFVDRRDLKRFASLAGKRTIVAPKEEILPKGIIQIPGFNRWFSTSTLVPVSGWLVQQIAKIAVAQRLSEATLVMVDSDAVFVRDVEPAMFAAGHTSRLYRRTGGITADMTDHLTWHRNACKLLDVPPATAPVNDYIGQIISWNRDLVMQMCARIEMVTGRSWHAAMAMNRAISEYLLYGIFIEKVLGPQAPVWIDERSRCKTHWHLRPLLESQLTAFSLSLDEGDFALMISSHSGTSSETRRAAIELATNGRLT